MKILVPIFLFFILVSGCSSKKSAPVSNQSTEKTDSSEPQNFFPVTEYLLGQLKQLDSMPVTPLKITSHNGKQDSVWMKREDIRKFAIPFLTPRIDSLNIGSLFTEKSFLDQSINAYTFSYDPSGKLPDTLDVKHWDVYIDATKNSVSRIYIVKETNNNGIHQTIQLTWRVNKWYKITTITEKQGQETDIKEETMRWEE
jgi:hypothetical protein